MRMISRASTQGPAAGLLHAHAGTLGMKLMGHHGIWMADKLISVKRARVVPLLVNCC